MSAVARNRRRHPAAAGVADACAACAFFSAKAALPAGLAAELPGVFADATGASQFSDTRTSLVDEPPLFSGGCTVRSTAFVTTQSDQESRSPTVVETTGMNPPLLSVACASLYFCPVMSGTESAEATPLPIDVINADAATAPATSVTAFLMASWPVVRVPA